VAHYVAFEAMVAAEASSCCCKAFADCKPHNVFGTKFATGSCCAPVVTPLVGSCMV